MLICDEFRKKCHVIFRNFLIAFLKVFKLLNMCTKFQVNKQQFSTHKIYHEDNFTPTFLNRVQGQNTLVGIGLIELNETSDTLNYRSFFKYCILQKFLRVFFCLWLYRTNSYGTNYFFDLAWLRILCYSIKASVILALFFIRLYRTRDSLATVDKICWE